MLVRPIKPDPDELKLGAQLKQFEQRFPAPVARLVRCLLEPAFDRFRMPVAVLLIFTGVFGVFLPPLGFIPMGLILLALDVPQLRAPLIRLLAWTNAGADAAEARWRDLRTQGRAALAAAQAMARRLWRQAYDYSVERLGLMEAAPLARFEAE